MVFQSICSIYSERYDTMGNLVYITGAPRCGKTTLAGRLNLDDGSILSLDALSKSVRGVFTDFKLYDDETRIQPNVNKSVFMELVQFYILSYLSDYPYSTLIVEGCHFTPEEFKSSFPDSKIICLGRTKSLDEIKKAIVTKPWMAELPAEKMNSYAEKIYNYSLAVKQNAKEYLYFETEEADIGRIKKYIK